MGLCPSKPEEGGGEGGGGSGAHVVADATEVSEREVVKRYRKGDQIGTGNFAEVFKATRLLDGPGDLSRGLEVAMKYIDKSNEECVPRTRHALALALRALGSPVSACSLDPEILATEARIMMSLHHPNCVRCYEVLETPKHVILALEMAENDLFSLYERPGKYTERDAARNVKDMADGIAYLHSKNIVHRDLKVLPLPPCAPRPPLRPRCPRASWRTSSWEAATCSKCAPLLRSSCAQETCVSRLLVRASAAATSASPGR